MALGLGLGLSMQIIPGGDGVSPTLSNSGLSVITYDNNSFDVDFIKATDDVSAQSVLVYKLYTSSSANIGTVANAEANGTLQATGTDVNSLTASTGITAPNTYHFNVVVEDEAGNKTAYTANSIALPYTDTTPPTVGTSTLSTSSVLSTSFDVDFAKATDDYSAQNTLVYKLYTSTSNNVSTVSDATTNGTLQDTQTDVTQLSASGLTASTTYYFNVVVEDEAGNKTAYTSNSETTSTSTDITPPAYTTSGTLTEVTVTASSITVGFDKCTDNVSPQSALVYKLYISISDPINTVEYAEAYGTLKDTGTDVDQLTASGLNSATFYEVNVVVEDEAGNKTAYFSRPMTTGGGGPF